MRNAAQPALFCEIFGDRTHQRIQLAIAGQLRLALDRGIAIPIGFGQVKGVDEFGKDNVACRAALYPFNGLSEGIWAHRLLPCDSCCATENAASRRKRRSPGSSDRARLSRLPLSRYPRLSLDSEYQAAPFHREPDR